MVPSNPFPIVYEVPGVAVARVLAIAVLTLIASPALADISLQHAIQMQRAWEREGSHPERAVPQWVRGTHDVMLSISMGTAPAMITKISADSGRKFTIRAGVSPSPAPDGRIMAFIRPGTGGEKGSERKGVTEELWISDLDGSRAVRIARLSEEYPWWGCVKFAWSPDSSTLLYSTCPYPSVAPEGDERLGGAHVRTYPESANQTAITKLWAFSREARTTTALVSHQGRIGMIGWLSSREIWFEQDNGGGPNDIQSTVARVNLDESTTKILVKGLQRQVMYRPVNSPDGTKLAILINEQTASSPYYPIRSDLAIETISDSKINVIEGDVGLRSTVGWSPDGRWVVFSKGPSTSSQLYATDMNGFRKALTEGDGDNSAPAFSSDGQLLMWRHQGLDDSSDVRVARWQLCGLGTVRTVSSSLSGMGSREAPRQRTIRWKSPDGMQLDGVLALPKGGDRGRPYSTIVIIHGGPQSPIDPLAREWPGGPYFTALLTERNYAVFFPDYRLSGAFGFAHTKARKGGDALLSGDMADIQSGVDTLVREGVADPRRLAVLGHSWGSVEVNWIVTHSNRFAAAISYEGADLLMGWGRRRGPDEAIEWQVGGNPTTDWDWWVHNSAINAASGATTPTMFVNCGMGVNDSSLEWLYSAWQSRHLRTQLVVYPNEPHVVQTDADRLDLLHRIIAWLEENGVRDSH